MRSKPRKNLIISTLCLMPCAVVSLPAQAAEDLVVPSTSVATPATHTVAPTATVATPTIIAPAPATTITPASNAVAPTPTPTLVAPAVTEIAPIVVTRPANEIGNLIAGKQHPYLTRADFSRRVADMDALYQASGYQPIWLSPEGKATKNVADVISLLKAAPSHGLNTVDYDTQLLEQKFLALKPPLDLQSKDLALYDTAISLTLLRFMHDLHYGRINPKDLHFNIQQRTEKTLDLSELIKSNLAEDSLVKIPALVEPKLPQYQKLKQALADYQTTDTIPPLKLITSTTIRAGNALPQATELQQFLLAHGDLSADKIDNTATTYTDNMVEGVKKFQQRQGLKANGIINKATLAAFSHSSSSLTSAAKASQIELAMERLRWLPEINEGRAVMVNIPAFQLFAFDDINQDAPTTTMRVVVGKSANHQTPLLAADMRFVDFQPYWNVPFKIARDEILPKLANDPEYLSRQNMEFVSSPGKSAALRIRQRPGKGNALGKVKFIFPNKSDVYLHDTPSVALFGRSRRDLSHGCVRVAQPQKLAEFVLKNEGAWDVDAIKKAMGGKNRRVVLKNTIPVFFLYNTAFFNENNALEFYTDIYHHDAILLEALKQARKDLSDEELIAPKQLVPPTDEPVNAPIEAKNIDSVAIASVKQEVTPVIKPAVTTDGNQLSPSAGAVTVTTTTAGGQSAVESTLSP